MHDGKEGGGHAARRGVLLMLPVLAACGGSGPAASPGPAPAPARGPAVARVETVTVVSRDPALERELAQAQLRVLEQEAVIEDLQSRLDEAQREVVRSLAKLQTSATRAEAASAMAEAELAAQSLRRAGGAPAEMTRATRLLEESSAEFAKLNYGGALYLANQVKTVATQRGQVASGERAYPGETAFAVPVRLEATSRSNVRDGPATTYQIQFTVETGAVLTGLSHTETWIRVTDADGRSGWIFQSLVKRR